MTSAAHSFTKTVSCPSCHDNFSHLFALAAHVESADKRCQLKHSDVFEIFLGQLTWNLIEVTGVNSDNRPKFEISQKAKTEFGPVKPAQGKLTYGHHQVYGARPQLTQGAHSSHDKNPSPSLGPQSHTQSQTTRLSSGDFPSLPSQQRPSTQVKPPQYGTDGRVRYESQPSKVASHPLARQIQTPSHGEVRPPQHGEDGSVIYQAQPQRERPHPMALRAQSQSQAQAKQSQSPWGGDGRTAYQPQPSREPAHLPSRQVQSQGQVKQPLHGDAGRNQYQGPPSRAPVQAPQSQGQNQGHHQSRAGMQQQSRPQAQPQAQGQQPARNLGSGLTAEALAQVSSWPGTRKRKDGDEDEAAWSEEGDAGW